jgi:hypothetical protein
MDPVCSQMFWSAMAHVAPFAILGVYALFWGVVRAGSMASRKEEEDFPRPMSVHLHTLRGEVRR